MIRPRSRFIFTFLTLILITLVTGAAVLLVKGYRFSPKETKILSGTGILSVTSLPEGASIYLDGHLTTATNTNINSLTPQAYTVKIVKEGFIPWEKKVEVKEGLVTEVKATLFRAIPSISPLTYNGAQKVSLSPDEQKLVFVTVPTGNEDDLISSKKGGIWVLEMTEQPIGFSRGGGFHQIMAYQPSLNYGDLTFRWSPDSGSVLVNFPDRHLLLDTKVLNDSPKDVTAIFGATGKSWDKELALRDKARLETIQNINFRNEAQTFKFLKWSPDETKILYSKDGQNDFKIANLEENKSFSMPKTGFYLWYPDSEHLLLVDAADNGDEKDIKNSGFKMTKVSVVEFDGFNKSEIFAGTIDPNSVYIWPDGSKLVVVSYHLTVTALLPNLYGINLK